MAYRYGIQRLLAGSRSTQKKIPPFSSTGVCTFSSSALRAIGGQSGAQCLISQDRESCQDCSEGKDWDQAFATRLIEARGISNVSMGVSSHDSDGRDEGSSRCSGLDVTAYKDWDRSGMLMDSRDDGSTGLCDERRHFYGIGSADLARLGSFAGGFSRQSFRRYSSSIGARSVPYGYFNGSMSRSFSSAAVVAEGTQIAVEGDQLNSLEAGLAGVSDAASTVASLPSSSTISEVAVAAADSSYPTAFVQYVIEGIHLSTGLPWWASIVATTAAIRVLVLPIMVYQMKATARLTLMRPEIEKLTNRIKESGYDPKVVEDNQQRMKALFIKHNTSPLSPILGAFIQAPIFMCFFFAIRNMAEKVESFKEGGALWFTDLSTPDSLFILPVLSGAFFLLTVELGATDGMQGQPMLGKMKMVLRGLAVLLVPLTASFPKALFCYWLTANVFSIIQAAVFKKPAVKDALGIPDVSHLAKPADIPVAPVMTFSQPPRLKGETRIGRPSTKRQRP